MSVDADVLIVGAGLSGLSLAVRLVEREVGGRIVLVDPRTEWGWDRTWCFWPMVDHPFEAAISYRWPRWRVAGAGRQVETSATGLPYCHIASDDLYRLALERLENSGRVALLEGVSVGGLTQRGDRVVAESSSGNLEASLAFDSRPPSQRAGDGENEVRLLQHFGGQVVRAATPVFDPTCVTLMDFEVPQEGAIRFVYVLPFDERRALVEDTWLSKSVVPAERYEAGIAEYLGRRFGLDAWTVESVERGVIPMTTAAPPRRRGRIIAIGLRGGLAKPSSGYAFLAVQRDSAALVEALGGWSGGPLPDAAVPAPRPPRPARTLALDRIFLAQLARHPERAPAFFVRLFERVDPATLVRFLSEAGDVRDDLRVMRALPTAPLVTEALRSRRLWWRRRTG